MALSVVLLPAPLRPSSAMRPSFGDLESTPNRIWLDAVEHVDRPSTPIRIRSWRGPLARCRDKPRSHLGVAADFVRRAFGQHLAVAEHADRYRRS